MLIKLTPKHDCHDLPQPEHPHFQYVREKDNFLRKIRLEFLFSLTFEIESKIEKAKHSYICWSYLHISKYSPSPTILSRFYLAFPLVR